MKTSIILLLGFAILSIIGIAWMMCDAAKQHDSITKLYEEDMMMCDNMLKHLRGKK